MHRHTETCIRRIATSQLTGGRRQGVLISILSAIGFIHDVGQFKTVNVSAGVQDFLICIEMAAVAIWHHWAFAFEPYRDPTKQPFFKDIRRTTPPRQTDTQNRHSQALKSFPTGSLTRSQTQATRSRCCATSATC